MAEYAGPPRISLGPIAWLRKNLFSTWYNALLTFLSLWVLYVVLGGTLRWALTEADWRVITANLRLFMVGPYPPEQVWRPALSVMIVSLLMGLSWGLWGGVMRQFAVSLAAAFAVLALLPFPLPVRLWLLGNLVVLAAGYGIGQRVSPRWGVIAWVASFPLIILIVAGIGGPLPPVSTQRWGGLLLTFILTIVGITASFPIGVLLALGRRSTLPVIRLFSIAFIEVVRGVPLVTVLFMGSLMLPLFLPEDVRVDQVVRAMASITLFSAAYMAENVRGGLQAIPTGQVEAARALGLNGFQTLLLIVLPQALRNVIPAIVGQFISLFKDTSLVSIIGLLDLVFIGKSVLANPDFLGLQREVYVFLALVYFVFSYAMSYASRRLEVALGVGER
ncbi:MAG: amino acid ABC transporter permease [Chloroflexi bacterium]|nr:MAG: amino acid ABC transporter permease [Chloroflexota bacterium]